MLDASKRTIKATDIALRKIIFVLLMFQSLYVCAQDKAQRKWTLSAYAEVYYSFDFSQPANQEKANFIYNHKKHNQLNANLLLVKGSYTGQRIRANLGLMTGNYAHYNLAAEPQWARYFYEANIGMKLSKKHNLWLDAGIMPSHIGFESAISADCWTLTRSILAENSPYFETGAKLSYSNKSEKLYLAFLVLNGWQRISRPDFAMRPSYGIQFTYKPKGDWVFNYSNFIGSDRANDLNSIRTFHNLYMQYESKKKIGVILGFDLGSDKYNSKDYGIWFSPVAILRYTFNERFKLAMRGEYYYDKNQILISTKTVRGFQVIGISTNFDYQINEKIACRAEAKMYKSIDPIFTKSSDNNFSLTANITVRL